MDSLMPTIVDLDAELAKLVMLRGRTPEMTMADRKGSAAPLGRYRDGVMMCSKFTGISHWETHPGDELIHVIDGAVRLEMVCDAGPPKTFELTGGALVVIPQGAWHRFVSTAGATVVGVTPLPGESIDLDVEDPRAVEGGPA